MSSQGLAQRRQDGRRQDGFGQVNLGERRVRAWVERDFCRRVRGYESGEGASRRVGRRRMMMMMEGREIQRRRRRIVVAVRMRAGMVRRRKRHVRW